MLKTKMVEFDCIREYKAPDFVLIYAALEPQQEPDDCHELCLPAVVLQLILQRSANSNQPYDYRGGVSF